MTQAPSNLALVLACSAACVAPGLAMLIIASLPGPDPLAFGFAQYMQGVMIFLGYAAVVSAPAAFFLGLPLMLILREHRRLKPAWVLAGSIAIGSIYLALLSALIGTGDVPYPIYLSGAVLGLASGLAAQTVLWANYSLKRTNQSLRD